MGMFNQEDGEDQEIPVVDFSGRDPIDPDSENETPSPVEPSVQQDPPQAIQSDDSAAYGQPVSGTEDPYQPIAPPAAVSLSPYADHSADYAAMQDQKIRERDENIKPSVGRRILAALAGGAITFGSRDSSKGQAAIESILGAPEANARERWARAEAPIQSRIAAGQAQDAATQRANTSAEQQGRINEQGYRNQIYGNMDAARARKFAADAAAKNEGIDGNGWKPDDPNNPLGGYSGVSLGGKPIYSSEPPKSVQLTSGYRRAAGAAMGLSGHELTRYALTGTMPVEKVPRQASADEMMWGTYVRSLGHAPTAQDVINFKRGTPGDNDPETVIAKNMQAKDAFENQWKRVGKDDATNSTPEGSYVSTDGTGRMMTGPEFNSRVEKFRTDLNDSTPMRKSGTQVDSNGNTISAGPAQQQVKHYQGKAYLKDAKTGQWVLQQPGR